MTPPVCSSPVGSGLVPLPTAAHPAGEAAAAGGPTRYDGLDLFRPLSVFGVVLFHFSQAFDRASIPAFVQLIRVRDCALPIFVMTSFFVLTRSLMANPGRGFGQFVAGRFRRLVVPCVIWTGVYWATWDAAGPLWSGDQASRLPAGRWTNGFVHLWFLHFLFLGGLVAFPVIRWIARHPRLKWAFTGGCVALAVAYWSWSNPLLSGGAVGGWSEHADVSVRVGVRQSIAYAKYPLLGIAVALMADLLSALYRRPAFRTATLAVAAGALVLHVSASAPAFSRALYSLAAFVALLRPWPPGALNWLRPAARYSYPIYIVHPAAAQVVLGALMLGQVASSLSSLIAGSVAVFMVSWAAAALLRALVPADWFLPLVPVGKTGEGRTRSSGVITHFRESRWPSSPST